jgi:hypothetical protein
MTELKKFLSILVSLLIVVNLVGCTKRVSVPPEQYEEVIVGEDFIYVTTANGDVFQLQEAILTEKGISGLLRHEGGDVKPVGLGGKEDRSAYIEIRREDVASVEVERINKRRLLLTFGAIAGGLIAAIAVVDATADSDDSGGGGGGVIKDPF